MRIEVVAQQEKICTLSKEDIERVVTESLSRADVRLLGKTISVGVGAVSLDEIRRLNRIYRKKDAPTDVLAFPEFSGKKEIEQCVEKTISLGDVLVSCEKIEEQAGEHGVSKERECVYLLSHGVLHLVGYDHEPEQFSIQDEICDILEEEIFVKKSQRADIV